ncbi:hypothetical protein [Endothiovibrio diazotrophicus]
MRFPIIIALATIPLAGCDGGMASLTDNELRAQFHDCKDLGGSRKIKAMTCTEVDKECARRQADGRYVCR